jgi:molybdate transport system ATP-binding protein
MISFHNATIARKGKKIFQNLHLNLEHNKHFVVRGLNGSGKTTLLEAIAGELSAIEGKISYSFIDEHLSWDDRFHQRKKLIHYIPAHALQSALGNHPDFFYQQRYYTMGDANLPTVQDFLGDSATFDRTAFPASFNIEKVLALELPRLSNGQLKKVLIIRELMKGIPKVLVMDYPLDGLDATSRTELCSFIDSLVNTFDIQIILTDHGQQLPAAINTQIMVDNCQAIRIETFMHQDKHQYVLEPTSNYERNVNESVIEMKNVQIKYGENIIIDRLDWRVNKGERWALTGRNGAGKTTIFSLIYADHPMAYSQHVTLFGKRRGSGESIWDIKNRISYLGPEQFHYLDPNSLNKTGRQYLHQRSCDEAVLNDLIKFFEVDLFIDDPLRYYSSGQLQLILLMTCFTTTKELLLLDEPFQFLDPSSRSRVNFISGKPSASGHNTDYDHTL